MKKLNSKAGFTIMAALGMGFVLAGASVAILFMRRSIDLETKNTAVKHARGLAEDIIKTQIAIQQNELDNRVDFLNFVKNFVADSTTGAAGFSVPVPVKCGDGPDDFCKIKILGVFSMPGGAPLTRDQIKNAPATLENIRFSMGLSEEDNKKLKMKIQPIDITVKLPSDTDMADKSDEIQSDLVCPIQKPIFKGTKPVEQGRLVADCLPVKNSESLSTSASVHTVTCDIQGGEWMMGVGANLAPSCAIFPNQVRSPASTLSLCPDGKVAKYYELGSSNEQKFTIKKVQCLDKGSPYDFMVEKKTWGVE